MIVCISKYCLIKYNIHIKFLVKLKFCIFFFASMKLRHKKPINSYKGQANTDKNEFNDDDFRQQGSPHKKATNGNMDPTYRYAQILAKFIKNINQSCREYEANNSQSSLARSPRKNSVRSSMDIEYPKEQSLSKRDDIQQQKQISKYQSKLQLKDFIKENKGPSKRKQITPKNTQNKQVKAQPMEIQTQKVPNENGRKMSLDPKPKDPLPNKKEKKETTMMPNNPHGVPNPPQPNQTGPNITLNSIQGGQLGNMYYQNNLNNVLNLSGVPGNMTAFLNQNQVLNMNMVGLGNLANMNGINIQQLMRCNINPNNYLIAGVPQLYNNFNMGMIKMNPGSLPPGLIRAPNQLLPTPNLFALQASTFKNTLKPQKSSAKCAFPLKRSAYHISIAYKIYLDKLKNSGANLDNLEEIDPTKNARNIKKNTQNSVKEQGKRKK